MAFGPVYVKLFVTVAVATLLPLKYMAAAVPLRTTATCVQAFKGIPIGDIKKFVTSPPKYTALPEPAICMYGEVSSPDL